MVAPSDDEQVDHMRMELGKLNRMIMLYENSKLHKYMKNKNRTEEEIEAIYRRAIVGLLCLADICLRAISLQRKLEDDG